MFNITPSEFLIIALLALVVLGPERLPDMARSLGRLINKAREMTADLRDSVDSIADDPSMKPLKDLGELATRPREKLAQFAAEAEAEDRARRAEEQARAAGEHDDGDGDPGGEDPDPDSGVEEDRPEPESATDEVGAEPADGSDTAGDGQEQGDP